MSKATQQRRSLLGFFADKPAPRLYDSIVEVLRVRHDSRRTEEACNHWIRRYIEFCQHRHPRQFSEGDVNRFLTHLAVKEHIAASTQNQALSAIFFFYEHVLNRGGRGDRSPADGLAHRPDERKAETAYHARNRFTTKQPMATMQLTTIDKLRVRLQCCRLQVIH